MISHHGNRNGRRTVIDRPANQIFDFFADASNNPAWQKGMRACEWVTEPPIRIGSQYRQHARFAGRKIMSVFEVTDYVPGHLIRIETIQSTFPIQVTRIVEPDGENRCVVRASITGGPRVPWPISAIAGWMAQRSVDADYDRLQALLST